MKGNTGGGAPRSNSSSSSASPPASAPTPSVNAAAMLVVPQPINASKMSGQPQGSIVSANGGTGRKYQCKMCPQAVQLPQPRSSSASHPHRTFGPYETIALLRKELNRRKTSHRLPNQILTNRRKT
ncbi:hypothetical protein L9F63_007315, partial [Diploptera punctata]